MNSSVPASPPPRSGYTLPVFVCAAAVAALRHLQGEPSDRLATVALDLLEPPQTAAIPIEQIARLDDGRVLAIARSDPGDNLDLTRHTPVWALVAWGDPGQPEAIAIRAGEGIGRQGDRPAIYRYARRLLQANLERFLRADEAIVATLILPEGRRLAARTSNAAFGVVEGLSLLGTSAIAHPLSAPAQLDDFREDLTVKARQFNCLVFCIGENGLDLARQQGIARERLVKTANWLGPLLAAAGAAGVQSILLFGYHGKLLKLAGGIFHTHHHLADGRLEILTAHAACCGLPAETIRGLFACPTAEAALQLLRSRDAAIPVYRAIAEAIDRRSRDYIRCHAECEVEIGSVLFDRARQIVVRSAIGDRLLDRSC
ncbi:cobalamin biosynthesis protein CbiD [Rubidibacter lacunae KORDI 51-2]|uniref:Cobalt-precorrin-5B C(1)-methyltransferase n=1 Tax=Rubidibacter lacunae KORDI 51-2 TaxID=582515 RepID=U5D9X1_9CHRO|nr:cobalt-precorrin-5B (C(1))-methyltransferase CbiD [Rubidibacter lacunae]ERN41383.1 cobalamin biosynthesis protein CbiD [Rubidibacter lacunae KORDI 51-2]